MPLNPLEKREKYVRLLGVPGTQHPLFIRWSQMRRRCRDKTNKYYGAKGVKVCDEWMDFYNFASWAVENGIRENPSLVIDRIDPNGDYCPKNCRLITVERNHKKAHNHRHIWVNIDGRTRPLRYWCNRAGIPPKLARQRIERGWSPEEAVTTPKMR